MQSCFKSYRQFNFIGVTVLVKPESAGFVYAIQNDIWEQENNNQWSDVA
jgi:hypothetical protein